MARVKSPAMPPRLVWRISVEAPNGLWVDPSKLEDSVLSQALPEMSSGSWVMSSFDLLHGTDITKTPTQARFQRICSMNCLKLRK
jgi:hypothetical protein